MALLRGYDKKWQPVCGVVRLPVRDVNAEAAEAQRTAEKDRKAGDLGRNFDHRRKVHLCWPVPPDSSETSRSFAHRLNCNRRDSKRLIRCEYVIRRDGS
jgi:hypothetical protein